MGYVICRVSTKQVRSRLRIALLYLLGANAPDLDFIPGFLIGEPGRYHHGITHSIGFALLIAFAFSLFLYLRTGVWIVRTFAICFCVYFSHIFLDYFSMDTSEPYGVPLFWPLSDKYYMAPFAVFLDVQRLHSFSSTFIPGLFSSHNFWAMCIELVVFVPIIFLLFKLRRRPYDPKGLPE